MKAPFASIAVSASEIAMPTRLRFIAKMAIAHRDDCWEWTGSRTPQGYGRFNLNGRCTTAQRVAYALFYGHLRPGLTVDHRCRNRGCVNPAHLEAVPHRVNIMRGDCITAKHARKTHCDRGHELALYDGPNHTQRYCPVCKRANGRAWMRQRRAQTRQEAIA